MSGHVLLPGYFDPVREAEMWQHVVDRAADVRMAVLNPASGPGRQAQSAYLELAERLRHVGIRVLGYVDTSYGLRSAAEVEDDVQAYRSWYDVDGVFYDQVTSGIDGLDGCARNVQDARSAGCRTVVLNPGVHPHPAYADLCNLLVTFDGSREQHRQLIIPSWVRDLPRERLCHLVYGVAAADAPDVHRAVERAHAAVSYLTDGSGSNPWGTLSGHWPRSTVAA